RRTSEVAVAVEAAARPVDRAVGLAQLALEVLRELLRRLVAEPDVARLARLAEQPAARRVRRRCRVAGSAADVVALGSGVDQSRVGAAVHEAHELDAVVRLPVRLVAVGAERRPGRLDVLAGVAAVGVARAELRAAAGLAAAAALDR